MVLALNTVSGQVSDVPPKLLVHPHFSKYLVAVEDGQKPYAKELYKPGTVKEKQEQRSGTSLFSFMKKDEPEETESNIDIEEEN
jgi:hypothetical protein